MQYSFSFSVLFLATLLVGQHPPSLRIVYENPDAYNPLKQRPYMAPYINRVDQAKPIQGKERSTLRLYEGASIYTIDSVYVEFSGNKAKVWRYSIMGLRDYTTNRSFSIYPNLPAGFAYFEKYNDELVWEINRAKTKNILGLKCHYATMKIQQDIHQIWFTNDLPYKNGPFLPAEKCSGNLPGLVLEHIMGDGHTTTAKDIEFVTNPLILKDKIAQLQPWKKTPKPSYPPDDPESDGFMLINKEFPLQIWTPLIYSAEGHKGWLSN